MDQIVMLRVEEFREIVSEIKQQVSADILKLRSVVVEVPLTRKEAAKYLKVSLTTLDKRIRSGEIPSNLVHYNGSTPYFFPSELHQLIKQS